MSSFIWVVIFQAELWLLIWVKKMNYLKPASFFYTQFENLTDVIMQVSVSSKTIPPGHDLKGAIPHPRETIIVYKNPPLGTEQRVKSPTPRT